MIKTYGQPYAADNAGRSYPIADDTEFISNGAILDCRILVRKDVGTPYVAEVSVGDRVSVTVAVGGTKLVFSSADGNRIVHASSNGVNGWMTFGSLDEFSSFSGVAPLAKTVVVNDMSRVTSIASRYSVMDDDADEEGAKRFTARLSGKTVKLVPGYNTEPRVSGSSIRFDVSRGAGIGEYCRVVKTKASCGTAIFSINGETPDSSGDLKIAAGPGIKVVNRPNVAEIDISVDNDVYLKLLDLSHRIINVY